jgi:hypothetical protein
MSSGGLFGRSGTKVVYQNNAQGGGLMSSLVSAAAGSSHTFSPLDLGNVKAWYRADLGASASAWLDQSLTGDANQNLAQASGPAQPTLNASDAAFNNQKSFSFSSSQFFSSGTFAAALAAPCSALVIAKVPASNEYLVNDVNTADVWAIFANALDQIAFLAPNQKVSTSPASGAFAYIIQQNGASSKLNLSQTTSQTLSTPGANSLTGIMVGNYKGSQVLGGATIAEIVLFTGTLTQAQIDRLNTYANTRYGIAIGA